MRQVGHVFWLANRAEDRVVDFVRRGYIRVHDATRRFGRDLEVLHSLREVNSLSVVGAALAAQASNSILILSEHAAVVVVEVAEADNAQEQKYSGDRTPKEHLFHAVRATKLQKKDTSYTHIAFLVMFLPQQAGRPSLMQQRSFGLHL